MPSRTLAAYALALLVAIAVLAVTRAGLFDAVESRFVDWNFRSRPVEDAIDANLALIEVTDDCLKRHGDLPWRRTVWARLVDAARIGGAKVIGMDLLFDEKAKDPADDIALAGSLRQAGNVILAAELKTKVEFEGETGELRKEVYVRRPLAALDRAARAVGIVNIDFIYDNVDGILRVMPLAQKLAGKIVPTLALASACDFIDVRPSFLPGGDLLVGTYAVPSARARLRADIDRLEGENILRSAAEASAWVNYSPLTARGLFNIVTATDALEMLDTLSGAETRPSTDAERAAAVAQARRAFDVFRGKIVLLGVNASGIDMKNVPFGPMAGVHAQASVIRNLLEHDFLRRVPGPLLLGSLLLAGLLLPVGFLRWGLPVSAAVAAGVTAATFGAGVWLFRTRGVLLDVCPPVALVMGQFVSMKLLLLAVDLRRRIRSLQLLTFYSRRFNSTLILEELRPLLQESYLTLTGADAGMLIAPGNAPESLEVHSGSGQLPAGAAEWALSGEVREALLSRWALRAAPCRVSDVEGLSAPEPWDESDVVLLPLMHREAAVGWLVLHGTLLEANVTVEEDATFWTTLSAIAYTALENARHYELATIDGLTALQVRHIFDLEIEKEFGRAARYGGRLSLLLTDIDHFKSFNDTYGHQMGDRVLRLVADQVRRSIRLSDTAARYGGEEFAVILPETDYDGAKLLAERIRTRIEELRIPHDGRELVVTISIGLTSMGLSKAKSAKQFIAEADTALYAAKAAGRNRVQSFGVDVGVGGAD